MQTIEIQVNDAYMQNVLIMLGSLKEGMIEKVKVKSDSNLECDPYFYERKEHLHKLREDIRSGKEKMIPHDEFWEDIEQFSGELDKKYAN